jgi:two-component system, NarL family, nitrate/nitrite response regulator NarL
MVPQNVSPQRILFVDDHALFRSALRLLIEKELKPAVVYEAANRAEALEGMKVHPEVILLDVDLGAESGLDFLPELLEVGGDARVVVLTSASDPEIHRRAVLLGAVGLVRKVEVARVLIEAIRKVCAGEVWLGSSLIASVLTEIGHARRVQKADPETIKIASLTVREREVIALVGEGLRNKRISERLFISTATVRHYLTSIFSKLNVTDRQMLIVYAYQHGLAVLPPNPNHRRCE